MSREKEIVKLMEKRGNEIVDYEYKDLASEISKLFEVEGMVEYMVQRLQKIHKGHKISGGKWIDYAGEFDSFEDAKNDMDLDRLSGFKFRIVKRTTTDQIIEE